MCQQVNVAYHEPGSADIFPVHRLRADLLAHFRRGGEAVTAEALSRQAMEQGDQCRSWFAAQVEEPAQTGFVFFGAGGGHPGYTGRKRFAGGSIGGANVAGKRLWSREQPCSDTLGAG